MCTPARDVQRLSRSRLEPAYAMTSKLSLKTTPKWGMILTMSRGAYT